MDINKQRKKLALKNSVRNYKLTFRGGCVADTGTGPKGRYVKLIIEGAPEV